MTKLFPNHAHRRYRFAWKDAQGKLYAIKGVRFEEWADHKAFVDDIGGTITDWRYIA